MVNTVQKTLKKGDDVALPGMESSQWSSAQLVPDLARDDQPTRRPGVRWAGAEHRPCVPLTADEIHLWRAPLKVDADVLAVLSRPLSSDEHERARRFHFERDRVRWTAARGWLRRLLAGYLDAAAAELCFEHHPCGKPRLAAPAQWLRFNVSHSADIAAFAVAHGREVGVDVERVRDDVPTEPVARRFLSESEQATLAGLPRATRARASLQCWTAKEAYLKASGLGLVVPMRDLEVGLLADETIGLSARCPAGQPGRWSLRAFDAGPGYVGAVAVEGHGARIPVAAKPLQLPTDTARGSSAGSR